MIDFNLISQEYIKCFSDKSRIYMITNYLKTYDATQRKEVPFNLFPKQREGCIALGEGGNIIFTKPRQSGITTTVGAFLACEVALADKETPHTILVIGNTLDLAQQMVTKIREFLYQLPRWFWGEEYFDVDPENKKNKEPIFKICNQKELVLTNGCRVVARSSGENASRGVGGVSYLVFDEASFIEHGKDVYASALATVSTGGNVIMISTPNGKDQLYYETYRQAKEGKNNFKIIELKWEYDPRYNRFLEWTKRNKDTGEVEIIKEKYIDEKGNIEYNPSHILEMERKGYKSRSPWYVNMCKGFNNNPQKIAQELDVSFLGSDSTVIDAMYIEMQRTLNSRDPDERYKDISLQEMWIWKPPYEGHRYLLACQPTGEKVLTDKGLKNIEDVTLSDKLVNKDGEIVKINTLKNRMVEDEIMVEFKLKNMFNTIKFTWNHPIWSSNNSKVIRNTKKYRSWRHNFTFNNAIDIDAGDWVQIPNVYRGKTLSDNEILEKWDKYSDIVRADYRIDNPLLDEEFWWYCGMWLAEGWSQNDKNGFPSLHTAHHKKETEIITKVKSIAERLFKRKTFIKYMEKDDGCSVQFSCSQVSKFLTDNFSKYAKNKRIPEWVKFLPENLKLNLIKGYFEGDGCVTHNNIYMVSVSKSLLMGIQDMLFSVGIISALYLSSKEKYEDICARGKISHCSEKYTLNLGKFDTKLLLDMFGIENGIEYSFSRRPISNCYFSSDKDYIYVQIKEKNTYKYTGRVYNFDCETHTYCGEKIATHNCDNSRGDSDDATAIEIIDMDGIDDDGMPCIEQVAEYNGKLLGDAVGEIANSYGHMYNDAFIIVEDIGGYGSATLLTLMALKYPNLYYDDPSLKKFTAQEDATPIQVTKDGLPGFHSNSVRFQMLSNFANLIKTNQYKIRSERTLGELETWIFKNGKMDHKDGCHDDTITCQAMALFVMEYSINRQEKARSKDAVMLRAMIDVNNRIVYNDNRTPKIGESLGNKYQMPVYRSNNKQTTPNSIYQANMWLLK